MFERVLDCPQCQKRFHYEYDGEKYPEQIKCPECGKDSPYGDYCALVLCRGCRGKLKIPLDILHEEGNTCPKCGEEIHPDSIGNGDFDSTYTITEGVSRKQSSRMLEDGAFFDKFKIIKLLGRGGMAEVYLAEHLLLKQVCALKLMQRTLDQNNDLVFVKRFVREAKLTHSFNHPNIVRVFDAGSEFKTGYLFLAMEYVEGKTLHDIIRERALSENELLEILQVIGSALKTLEAAKVVHRDIKPSNIMYTKEGVYKLMDLGIAKVESNHQAGDMTLTMEQSTIGTPGYASPEQCQAAHMTDIRSDIYSLGASLYHAASGVVPFTGETPVAVILKSMQDDAEPLRNYRSDLSDGFIKLVEKMMMKKPEDRFQNIDELLEAAAKVEASKSLPAPVRKVQTAVAALATTVFFRKKEEKKKSALKRVIIAGLKLIFTILVVAFSAFNIHYVIVYNSSNKISYADFWKEILGMLNSGELLKKQSYNLSSRAASQKKQSSDRFRKHKLPLGAALQKMYPLIRYPNKDWMPHTDYSDHEEVNTYPVVSVSSEKFRTYSFDAVHEDFLNLNQGIISDGILDLTNSGSVETYKMPKLKHAPGRGRVILVVNFMHTGEQQSLIFSCGSVKLLLLDEYLHLIVNNNHVNTKVKIPANRWANLAVALNIEERKIVLLSENRLLGAWLWGEETWGFVSTVSFGVFTAGRNLNARVKIDFLAYSSGNWEINPVQPARYEAFQTHEERLPDMLPNKVSKPKSATEKLPETAEKTAADTIQVPAEGASDTTVRKAGAYFPVWRDLKNAKIFDTLQSVDEHYADLVVEYNKNRREVDNLLQSVEKIPDFVPENIRQERLAIAKKARELCDQRAARLKYLKTRNKKINEVKAKVYDRKNAAELRKEIIAKVKSGNTDSEDPRFTAFLLKWISDANNDPNVRIFNTVKRAGYAPIIKTLGRSQFIARSGFKQIFTELLKRHVDPVLEPEDLGDDCPAEDLAQYGVRGGLLDVLFNKLCRDNKIDALTALFADGAIPRKTQLFQAVQQGKYELVLFLLACGADPNWTNEQGKTALFYVCSVHGEDRIRTLLLAGGAAPGIISGKNRGASDFKSSADLAEVRKTNSSKIKAASSSEKDSGLTDARDSERKSDHKAEAKPSPSVFSVIIRIGVDHELDLHLEQQKLVLQSSAKSLCHPELKKYRGFYSRTPECTVIKERRMKKWNFKQPLILDKSKSELYIADVKLLSSSRRNVTVHPGRDNSVAGSNTRLLWDSKTIHLEDPAPGPGAFVIKIVFSDRKVDLKGKSAYVSRHALITR